MPENALVMQGLGHAYRAGAWVFRGYDAVLERGRSLAVLGPNGAGKSTLLRLILGLAPPTEGMVRLNGSAAFVPQLFQVGLDYTALDMVLMGRARHVGLLAQPSAKDRQAALDALDHFGMADLAGRPFHALSGGQRQIVIFARALVSEAEILVLDEPASALDLKNQEVILSWIARLSRDQGLTVIFTTHHPQHAFAVADKALLMLAPDRYVVGDAGDILNEENLTALYGVPIQRFAYGETHAAFVPLLRI